MIDSNDIEQIFDRDVVGSDGKKIGKAGQVFLDDETGQPEWVTVNTGLFGTNESFVPLREASITGDGVSVPYTKDKVKDAPNVDPDGGHLSHEEEEELFRYYGLTGTSAAVGVATTTTTPTTTSRMTRTGRAARTSPTRR